MTEPVEHISVAEVREAISSFGVEGALGWFSASQIPVPLQDLWEQGSHAKDLLDYFAEQIEITLKEL